MLTPRDITESSFPRSVFGGYDQVSVDEFLDTVQRDYEELTRQNEKLNKKIDELTVTLFDYQNAESRMRKEAVNAKRKGRLLYPIIGSQLPSEAADAVTASIDAEAASRDRLDSINSQLSDSVTQLDSTKAQIDEAEVRLFNIREEIALANDAHAALNAKIETERQRLGTAREGTEVFADNARKMTADFLTRSDKIANEFTQNTDKLIEDFMSYTSELTSCFRDNAKKLSEELSAGAKKLSEAYNDSLSVIVENDDSDDIGTENAVSVPAEETDKPDETDTLVDEISAAINGADADDATMVIETPKPRNNGNKKKRKK